jgi:tryptophan-rich sensory protein
MKKINLPKLISSLAICFSAAAIGTYFTMPSIGMWYVAINKPWFNPPNWVFAPVWTILYIMMAISLYIVWNKKTKFNKQKEKGLMFFGIQLFLNALWPMLFFGIYNLGLAYCEIIFLWLSVFLTIRYFTKISNIAANLLYPYILWVSFAASLNLAIYVLNI